MIELIFALGVCGLILFATKLHEIVAGSFALIVFRVAARRIDANLLFQAARMRIAAVKYTQRHVWLVISAVCTVGLVGMAWAFSNVWLIGWRTGDTRYYALALPAQVAAGLVFLAWALLPLPLVKHLRQKGSTSSSGDGEQLYVNVFAFFARKRSFLVSSLSSETHG